MDRYKKCFYVFACLLFFIFAGISVRSDWAQYQFSLNSSGFFPTNNSFDSASLINLTNTIGGSSFQPLVGDLDWDDANEIVVFGSNNIFVFNAYLNLKTQYNTGGNILAQPALFNLSGNKGLELILSLNVSDVHYFMVYNYSDNFTPISSLTIANNLTGSGIKCTVLNDTKSCIFMDNSFFIHVVNLSDPANPIDNATQVSLSPNRANTTNYETIPAIADYDSDGSKEALFWNDNDAGSRFGFVVFDLITKTKKATPSSASQPTYAASTKVGQPIFVKIGSDSFTQVAFASNTGTQGQIKKYNGSGIGISTNKPTINLNAPDLAFLSGTLLAIDCDGDGFEDIAGMAEGGAATRSRLFCYNVDNTQLYSINNIESEDIIERAATAVNISGNSTPEFVTYKGIYSFNGTLIYGFSGLGTQAPIPIDVNNDGKLDFLWADGANGVRLFISNDSAEPAFSNLIKSPEPSFKSQIVYINVTWQDNAGIDSVFISHNGTGNWVNYTAGSLSGNNVHNLTVPAGSSNYSLKVIGWYSTANDTAGNRNTTPVQIFTVNNRAPNATSVLLSNTDFQNRANGSIAGSWQFSDPDNDNQLGNETLWYINGAENISFRNLSAMSSGNLSKSQNWTFSVRVFDGANFSVFVNSTPLIIQDSAPNQLMPEISSSDGQKRKNGTLSCNNQSTSDFDGDLIANLIHWYKNNVLADAATNSITLNPSNYSKNDNLTCEVTPSDGTLNGTPQNSTAFTILNAAPILNGSIQNQSWNQDSSATINISSAFLDIDGDNLTYNYTMVSDIAISIDNNTAIAALTPSPGFSGIRNAVFFAFDGINLTGSNNITLNVNAVSSPPQSGTPSSGGSGVGGGGSAGNGGYQCDLDWTCAEWSACNDNKQTRNCKLAKVPEFFRLNGCPQQNIPEQGRYCPTLEVGYSAKESCSDKIKNQDETGIDCGGSCPACLNAKTKNGEDKAKPGNMISGYAVGNPGKLSINYLWLLLVIILIIAALFFYLKSPLKRIFKKEQSGNKEQENNGKN